MSTASVGIRASKPGVPPPPGFPPGAYNMLMDTNFWQFSQAPNGVLTVSPPTYDGANYAGGYEVQPFNLLNGFDVRVVSVGTWAQNLSGRTLYAYARYRRGSGPNTTYVMQFYKGGAPSINITRSTSSNPLDNYILLSWAIPTNTAQLIVRAGLGGPSGTPISRINLVYIYVSGF